MTSINDIICYVASFECLQRRNQTVNENVSDIYAR